jgi:hypothetical protein
VVAKLLDVAKLRSGPDNLEAQLKSIETRLFRHAETHHRIHEEGRLDDEGKKIFETVRNDLGYSGFKDTRNQEKIPGW